MKHHESPISRKDNTILLYSLLSTRSLWVFKPVDTQSRGIWSVATSYIHCLVTSHRVYDAGTVTIVFSYLFPPHPHNPEKDLLLVTAVIISSKLERC